MDDELENIHLDFRCNELPIEEKKYMEILLSNNICDIECLGSPFLPKCQTNSCPCDNFLRNERNKNFNKKHSKISVPRGKFEGEVKDHRINNEKQTEAAIKKKNASLHLDEFLFELLNKGGYEAYLHWTVKERKEFKITKPQRIAALWGDIKNRKSRDKMTDEKLLRGLRYSIKKGRVEKTDSQNLMFRFLN